MRKRRFQEATEAEIQAEYLKTGEGKQLYALTKNLTDEEFSYVANTLPQYIDDPTILGYLKTGDEFGAGSLGLRAKMLRKSFPHKDQIVSIFQAVKSWNPHNLAAALEAVSSARSASGTSSAGGEVKTVMQASEMFGRLVRRVAAGEDPQRIVEEVTTDLIPEVMVSADTVDDEDADEVLDLGKISGSIGDYDNGFAEVHVGGRTITVPETDFQPSQDSDVEVDLDPQFEEEDWANPPERVMGEEDLEENLKEFFNPIDKLKYIRDVNDGKFPSYAWPGGCPIYYVTSDNGVLCPECVNGNREVYVKGDKPEDERDPQWELANMDLNYEDPQLYCDHCGKRIESAYADEDEEGDSE